MKLTPAFLILLLAVSGCTNIVSDQETHHLYMLLKFFVTLVTLAVFAIAALAAQANWSTTGVCLIWTTYVLFMALLWSTQITWRVHLLWDDHGWWIYWALVFTPLLLFFRWIGRKYKEAVLRAAAKAAQEELDAEERRQWIAGRDASNEKAARESAERREYAALEAEWAEQQLLISHILFLLEQRCDQLHEICQRDILAAAAMRRKAILNALSGLDAP